MSQLQSTTCLLRFYDNHVVQNFTADVGVFIFLYLKRQSRGVSASIVKKGL
jgi:hypothetical protein